LSSKRRATQAARAERQYDTVEPENRLVAETLERRWNEALARVGELERRLELLKNERSRQPMPDRERLLALAQRFPETWSNPATDYRVKKRLVRVLIEEIIASVVAEQSIQLTIHWKGDKHSILYVRKSRIGEHRHTTQREVVEVVRELARTLPDGQIARVLNAPAIAPARGIGGSNHGSTRCGIITASRCSIPSATAME